MELQVSETKKIITAMTEPINESEANPVVYGMRDWEALRNVYRDGLLDDTLPFWLPRSIDREHGGFITSLARDGSILQTDKAVWFQGRFAWMLATLYNTV